MVPGRFARGNRNDSKNQFCCLLVSDDGGQTWTSGAAGPQGTWDGTAIERGDGSILLSVQGKSDHKRRTLISRDGGTTLGDVAIEHGTERVEDGIMSSMLALTTPAGTRAVFAGLLEGEKAMTLRLSADEGRTWPVLGAVKPFATAALKMRSGRGTVEILPDKTSLLVAGQEGLQVLGIPGPTAKAKAKP